MKNRKKIDCRAESVYRMLGCVSLYVLFISFFDFSREKIFADYILKGIISEGSFLCYVRNEYVSGNLMGFHELIDLDNLIVGMQPDPSMNLHTSQ